MLLPVTKNPGFAEKTGVKGEKVRPTRLFLKAGFLGQEHY
jgi:hypothetical protein